MMIQHQAESKGQLFLIYYEDKLIGTIDLHKIDLKQQSRNRLLAGERLYR